MKYTIFGVICLLCFSFGIPDMDFNTIATVRDFTCGLGQDPFRNHLSSPVCTCKRNVRGKLCSECRKNAFDLRTDHPQGCLRCFCSGKARRCQSAELHQKQVQLTDDDYYLENPSVFNASNTHELFYWKIKLRNQVIDTSSYGGILSYRFDLYEGINIEQKTGHSVHLKGNGIELHTKVSIDHLSEGSGWFTVLLWEQYWNVVSKKKPKKCKCKCCKKMKPKVRRAKRKDLMMVLSNLEEIKISYILALQNPQISMLREIWATKGSPDSSSGQLITQVEQCYCPPGYGGLSCNTCANGYKKVTSSKSWLGFDCEPCQCHGNSDTCDPDTGICLMCQNDTTGDYCERKILKCDRSGTLIENGIQLKTEERCLCKSRVKGLLCDQCRRGSFALSGNDQHGCKKCWCSRVTNDCSSSNLTREAIPVTASFINLQDVQSLQRAIETVEGQATYRLTNAIGALRWLLPKRATGNLLESYGGKLIFTIQNIGYCQQENLEPFVKLESHGGKSINWIFEPKMHLNVSQSYTITLKEDNFRYLSLRISRNFFLRILSSVKNIYIYTPRCSEMVSISIRDITLESVINAGVPPFATDVEVCKCPYGYTGNSCENCDAGFIRVTSNRCVQQIP